MEITRRKIILLAIIVTVGGYGIYYFSAIQISHVFYLHILGIRAGYDYSYMIIPSNVDSNCLLCPKNTPSTLQGTNIVIDFTADNTIRPDDVIDLNIDAFGIHINQTSFSTTKHIEFVADKLGTFPIYSKLHPEMHGTITIVPNLLPWL